jgi:DNA repair protein RadC
VIPIVGIRGEMVTDVAQRLLVHLGGLRGLFRLDVAELARIRSLGDAKAVRLKAALELGRRLASFSDDPPRAGTPDDVGHVPPPLKASRESGCRRC